MLRPLIQVDKDTGKLTVQHGPLTNLGMPGMTMAFKVQNPAMLDGFQDTLGMCKSCPGLSHSR